MLSCFYDTRRNVNATRCEMVNLDSMARTAAWVRADTPSLVSMLRTCAFTVLTLKSKFWAIWGLVWPWLRSFNTPTSLGVRLSICSAPLDCSDPLASGPVAPDPIASGWDARDLTPSLCASSSAALDSSPDPPSASPSPLPGQPEQKPYR